MFESMEKLKSFTFKDETLSAKYLESMEVTDGVVCDVYIHPETEERDLGIVTIQPGRKTPLQKVLSGEETIEGLVSGKGTLTITHKDGSQTVHSVDETEDIKFAQTVEVGEIMQWQADPNSELVIFEICYPPYEDGRFENIEETS